MLNKKEIEQAEEFLLVLNKEVNLFEKKISWKSSPEIIDVYLSDKYQASISSSENNYVVKNSFGFCFEKSFLDAMARLRFEMMRHVNPKAFPRYN